MLADVKTPRTRPGLAGTGGREVGLSAELVEREVSAARQAHARRVPEQSGGRQVANGEALLSAALSGRQTALDEPRNRLHERSALLLLSRLDARSQWPE